MARPVKRNLSYSTWDVDVLENDNEIDELIDAQGPAGFYVYFALCQKAYATDGYFFRWGYGNAASTARKLGGGLKSAQVRAIVELCLSLGFWDKTLFTQHGILTSRAIQSRYLDGIARRTGPIEICLEYWLLEPKPVAGLVFVHKNGINVHNNPSLERQKQGSCTVNDINLNEMNPPTLSPPRNPAIGNVENSRMDGRQSRIEACTRLLAFLQSVNGINYQGDKQTRRAVYALFDRGYTEKDVRAVINIAYNKGRDSNTALPPPLSLFGSTFDGLITTSQAQNIDHPEYSRDHYAPQPQLPKGGLHRNGYQRSY